MKYRTVLRRGGVNHPDRGSVLEVANDLAKCVKDMGLEALSELKHPMASRLAFLLGKLVKEIK